MGRSSWKKATLMLAPHDGATIYSVRFPAALLRMLPLLLLAVVAGLALLVVDHLETRKTAKQVRELLAENRSLQRRVDRIDEMEKELESLERFGGRIRTFAGLGPPSEDTAEPPQGGPLAEEDARDAGMDAAGFGLPPLSKGPRDLQQRLLLQRVSFEEILGFVMEQRETLARTPAIWPVSFEDCSDRWISSGYGNRRSPFSGALEFHGGVDIVAPKGAPIRASADGIVQFAGTKPAIGRTVRLRHSERFETRYGHCEKILVQNGEQVRRGDPIATVGNTGRSTGVHLHYEVRRNGKTVNPMEYMLD